MGPAVRLGVCSLLLCHTCGIPLMARFDPWEGNKKDWLQELWACRCGGLSHHPSKAGVTSEWYQPPLRVACRVCLGRPCFGGTPAPAGVLNGKGPVALARLMESVITGSTSVQLSRLGERKRNGAHQHFCFWRNLLKIPIPPRHVLGLVNECFSRMPQGLFKLWILCCLRPTIIVFLPLCLNMCQILPWCVYTCLMYLSVPILVA